ncbi:hypothetical protein Tco_1104303 [Tanacetum coccineum]
MSSSTVTYTSIYYDSDLPPWGFHLMDLAEFEAPPSPDYVSGPEHLPLPDYVHGLEEPKQAPLSPDYAPEPEYPDYLVPSDVEAPIEDQPLLDDPSPTSLSPGYVADSDPKEDPVEDPEEDPAKYPADRGDDDDDDDNDDDDDDDKQEEDVEEDEEEEEYIAPIESTALHVVDPVSSAKDTVAFETNKSAPTPPSPRSRRARIFVRPQTQMLDSVESCITIHPPSIKDTITPLLLPSTTHRDDLPEADMPLQKRARFTTPTGRFEVEESSSAAATRQAGHTLSHIVDYGFIDTIDASIRASESKAMTAALAHSESRSQAMEAQIRALQRDVNVLQRQRSRDEDRLTSHIQHEYDRFRELKMPPKRTAATTTPAPMTDAQIKALIAQGVADALEEIKPNRTSRNGNDNHDSGTSSKRTERAASKCTYIDFLKCQPLNFKGIEGVVILTQWFEKMDSVFHISNCTVACQIKFATCTLLGNALTWWNSHVKTVGHDATYGMSWKTLKKMMTAKYCPRGEIKKLEIEL